LDVKLSKTQVLELVQAVEKRLGMAMLLITTNLTIVRRYARRVVVGLEQGRLVKQAKLKLLFTNATAVRITKRLLERRNHRITAVRSTLENLQRCYFGGS